MADPGIGSPASVPAAAATLVSIRSAAPTAMAVAIVDLITRSPCDVVVVPLIRRKSRTAGLSPSGGPHPVGAVRGTDRYGSPEGNPLSSYGALARCVLTRGRLHGTGARMRPKKVRPCTGLLGQVSTLGLTLLPDSLIQTHFGRNR